MKAIDKGLQEYYSPRLNDVEKGRQAVKHEDFRSPAL